MHENMTFVIGKLVFVQYQFVFRGGGVGRVAKAKDAININRFEKRTGFIIMIGINCTNKCKWRGTCRTIVYLELSDQNLC